jgi:Heterokaryon incompatibility protein (HET)
MSRHECQSRELYAALPLKADGEIRLLKASQDRFGGVTCELEVFSFNLIPAYDALSYTWGPATHEQAARGITSERIHPVLCNGHEILVTENLYNFLTRYITVKSFELHNSFMWIDSLCIDQANDVERMSQVKIMATIYRSAESVLVWLGEQDSEHTKKSFDLIRFLTSLSNDSLKQVTPKSIETKEVQAILDPYGDISYWTAIKKLFERKYFTRVWIMQEIMFAKKILVLCGEQSMNWILLAQVSEFLTISTWTRWICPTGVLPSGDTHQSSHGVPNLLRANSDTKATRNEHILLYSLIRARRFEASDSRDKVYGVLGIAGDLILGKPRFDPVYKDRTVEETFTKAAIQILEDSRDLLLLTCSEGDEFRTLQSLPSWVPDWACNRVLGLGVTGYRRFWAAGNLEKVPRYLEIDENHLTLTVRGFLLDDIVAVGECKHEVLHGRPFPQWLGLHRMMSETYFTGESRQSRGEVFWRSLITNTAGPMRHNPAPVECGSAFAFWISSKLSGHSTESYNSEDLSLFLQSLATLKNPTARSTTPSLLRPTAPLRHRLISEFRWDSDPAEYETTFSYSPHQRPFLTRQNHFGIGSESLAVGDTVWIVAGCPVLLILRKLGQDFQISGGAYVHGFMNPEKVELDERFEKIRIV